MAVTPVSTNWATGHYTTDFSFPVVAASGDLLVVVWAWANQEGNTAVPPPEMVMPSYGGWSKEGQYQVEQGGIGAGGVEMFYKTAEGTDAERFFDAFFGNGGGGPYAPPGIQIWYAAQAFRADSGIISVAGTAVAGGFTSGDLTIPAGSATDLKLVGAADTGLDTVPSTWAPGWTLSAQLVRSVTGGAANRPVAGAVYQVSNGATAIAPNGTPTANPPGSRPWGTAALLLTEVPAPVTASRRRAASAWF